MLAANIANYCHMAIVRRKIIAIFALQYMDMIRYFFIALLSLTFAACQNKTSGEQANDSTAKAAALPQEAIDTLQQVVMRTQQQNKLYTTECKIHKVVLFSDTKKNRWKTARHRQTRLPQSGRSRWT